MKIISWNLLRLKGASLDDVARLIERERPDLMLMQEATHAIDHLPERIGGAYARAPLPGRIHGLAAWSPAPFRHPPAILPLPAGAVVLRVCQIIDLGPFALANVHLSHGQLLNRRQLRRIAQVLPHHAAVLGDFNLVGPPLLPGFHDVGPRQPTHVAGEIVPLRIDRCLARGLACAEAHALPRGNSDHRPIVVRLSLTRHDEASGPHAPELSRFRPAVRLRPEPLRGDRKPGIFARYLRPSG
ncbi:MAG TPA: endonuclease/exonuclease/phosphatase family protein [Acetobacteraceae bacterium]|nr:endonuclease/exonuclease/phosphatase family protein [Acetobacteraceae bacterium]